MSYDVYLTETFRKTIKVLKKKYRHIKNDISFGIKELEKDPSIGDAIPEWNNEIWKIRVASSDMKKGKRGGFRIIYFWKSDDMTIYLLATYFKGIKTEITKKEIEMLLKMLDQEMEES